MRSCRKHDERIRAAGQQAGECSALAAGAAFGDIVGLVDEDDVPVGLFEIRAVKGALLQSVDRDDSLVDIQERIVTGGNALLQACDAI